MQVRLNVDKGLREDCWVFFGEVGVYELFSTRK